MQANIGSTVLFIGEQFFGSAIAIGDQFRFFGYF
jgi:hypothetical protein